MIAQAILNSKYYNQIRFNPLIDLLADWKSGFTKRNLAFYRSFLNTNQPNKLVFDIGANKGHKVQVFRKMGFDVIAVDPEPKCLETLRYRFGNDKKVTIIPNGVAEAAGILELQIQYGRSGLNTFSQKESEVFSKKVQVEVTTLDALMQQYGVPYFIKIDVEGYEWNVIQGMKTLPAFLSFEANFPHYEGETLTIIRHLSGIHPPTRFNFSTHEQLETNDWMDATAMEAVVQSGKFAYMEIVCWF